MQCKDKKERIISELNLARNSTIIELGCADLRPYSEYLIEYFDEYTAREID